MGGTSIPDRLTLPPGASTMLEAPGDGVGGYLWSAVVDAGPGRIEQIAPETSGDAIGGGATARFRLTWLGEASGSLTLQLKRPWEDAPIELRHVEVLCRKA